MPVRVRFTSRADRWVRTRLDKSVEDLSTASRASHSLEEDDPSFDLDDEGFLREPGLQASGWCRPHDVASRGGWVLLGEPGTGKSSEFRRQSGHEESADDPLPGGGGTVWVDAGDLGSLNAAEAWLGGHLDALPVAGSTDERARVPLLLVLDQLDECGCLNELPGWLWKRLQGKDTRDLRIWVACRTADYPSRLTDILTRALGRCVVGDLAPLTRTAAAKLISEDNDVDAETFLRWVASAGAGALARVPLTLWVLFESYTAHPENVDTALVQLFEHGVDVLTAEHDTERVRHWGASTREQRVAIAMRVATRLQFSARRSIHVHDTGTLTDVAVPLGQVVGAEATAGAGAFEVTSQRVAETLATGLFSRTRSTAQFAHSSYAAFLTARHLAERLRGPAPIPRIQLEELFLVAAPDEDTAAIPERLRETAAWLLAHAPTEIMWLAEADPEGLLAHTGLITDPDVRATIVDGLLARADRIELAQRGWQRVRWNLAHPGLREQLTSTLTCPVEHDGGWPTFARARLAIRVAGDSRLPGLADPLLRVLENPAWAIVLRRHAVKAVMAVDQTPPTLGRMRAVLAELQPPPDTHAASADWDGSQPDSPAELAGTLLRQLWPTHLSFTDVARFLRVTDTRRYLGVFAYEVSTLARGVADDDLPALLTRTEQVLRANGGALLHPDAEAEYEELHDEDIDGPAAPGVLTTEREARLRDLLDTTVDRLLGSPRAYEFLDRVAALLLWSLSRASRPAIPTPIDVLDAKGNEPDQVRDLRHALADALLRFAHDRAPNQLDHWTYRIISGWAHTRFRSDDDTPPGHRRGQRRHLLDSTDAEWALQQVAHYDSSEMADLAATFTALAEQLSPPPTPAEKHPALPPVDLDTVEKFAALQRNLLDRASEGDGTAFARLIAQVHYDPVTLRGHSQSTWRITDSPCSQLWEPADLADRFTRAAGHYLRTEHDHRNSWLGHTEHPRARAAMHAWVALHDPDTTHDDSAENGWNEIPADRWAHWVGAIIHHAGHFGHIHDQLDRALLARAAEHAPDHLADAITTLVRGQLTAGVTVRLPALPASMTATLSTLADRVASALLADEGSDTGSDHTGSTDIDPDHLALPAGPIRGVAFDSWYDLIRQPLQARHPAATELVTRILTERPDDPGAAGHQLALTAAAAMLAADATAHWPTLQSLIHTDSAFARELALHCGTRLRHSTLHTTLNEDHLVEIYRWLTAACSPENELATTAVHAVTPEEEVHFWRHRILETLAERGVAVAVHHLRALTHENPTLLVLQAHLHEARRRAQAAAATPLTPEQINEILGDHSRRVIHTAAQLTQVILETLDAIGQDLPGHGNLLWDRERHPPAPPTDITSKPSTRRKADEFWRPKDEGAIAAYLAHELQLRLVHARVIINREVVIRPTDAGDSGLRPDLKIDIITKDKRSQADVVTVPIEIKGSWHDEILTAQADQLTSYCTTLDTDHGIYLVGWFPINGWTMPAGKDRRKTKANRHGDVDPLHTALRKQAAEIFTSTGKHTHPYVLAIPRALPDNRTDT